VERRGVVVGHKSVVVSCKEAQRAAQGATRIAAGLRIKEYRVGVGEWRKGLRALQKLLVGGSGFSEDFFSVRRLAGRAVQCRRLIPWGFR